METRSAGAGLTQRKLVRSLSGAERRLSALGECLPDRSGVALGFDRLVMRAPGAKPIDKVLAFTASGSTTFACVPFRVAR
jgi:elongation factor P--beta-lysine ligase